MKKQPGSIAEILGRETIHPFPARMAPSIALKAISNARTKIRVLDPMVGSGTVLAVARAKGHQAFGVDLDPLAVLISKVWTTSIDTTKARETAKKVLIRARRRFATISEGDAYPHNADDQSRAFIRYWFDPYSRRQLCALARTISCLRSKHIRDVMWCAFSRLIIAKQAGASLAMDLSHSRPHKSFKRAPTKPFKKFLDAVDRVVENSINVKLKVRGPASKVYQGDARKLPIGSSSIDVVLTSPPYLNAIDYIRCSKFSLVWMGYKIPDLSIVRSLSVGSEAGDREKYSSDPRIRKIIDELDLKPRLKARERAIVSRYICDMSRAIAEVNRVLVPNGKAIFVVGENTVRGTYIKTAKILTAVAKDAGLRFIKRRARILPANRRYLPPPQKQKGDQINLRMRREVVLLFRKPKAS